LFEAWTWTSLGLQDKPSGLLNQDGYYDALLQFLDTTVNEGFLRPRYRSVLVVERELEPLLERLLS
jgi:predicted Rossmann-fold nucleotide-binding protein